jgi:hypothetical protein
MAMSERILIPLPGLGTLELPREVFEQHLVRPTAPEPASSASELVDADELERRTRIPASWWLTQARERRVPFRKIGRYVRFDVDEVFRCDEFRRKATSQNEMKNV